MTYEQLEEILRESRRLAIPAVEKNIFFIGGRGHYENPISDLLAFFLDIHETHGLGNLVLKSINEAAGLPPNDIDLITSPQREVRTDDEKRIDILLEGEDYVTVIENKIRHSVINPFSSYDAYLSQQYTAKRQNRVLLSVRNEIPPTGWFSLTYKNLLIRIKENLGQYVVRAPYSKWLILFREFLLNIEQECGTDPMTTDRFEFVYKNYEAICDLKKMRDEYISELQKKGLDALRTATDIDEFDVFARQENWNEHGLALRLYRKQWGGKSNIVLLLRPNGSFRVQFYVHDIPDTAVSKLRGTVGGGKYKKYEPETRTIHYFGDFDNPDLDIILKEIHDVAQKLSSYYLAP